MRSNLEHIKIMVTTIGFNGEHTHVAKPERIGLAGHPGDAIENCIKGPQGKFWVLIEPQVECRQQPANVEVRFLFAARGRKQLESGSRKSSRGGFKLLKKPNKSAGSMFGSITEIRPA